MSPILKNVLRTVYGILLLPFWLVCLYITFLFPYVALLLINVCTKGKLVSVDRHLKNTVRTGCKSLNYMKRLLCALVPAANEFEAESFYDV
ncbi:protein E22 [Elephant endotheliotropic herpesvirus 5B]|nr:protein E22 [Elephant endotheliotropic herpesvirus 5B]